MLQFIRSKVTSIFIKVLFGILILSFAIWGIGDIFLGQQKAETAISIGEIEYDSDDVMQEFERTRKAMRLPPEYLSLVKPQVLDSVIKSMVNNGLVAAETSNMKLMISENQLKNWIAKSPAFRDQLGKFSPELFRRNLYNADLTEEAFFKTLRAEIKRNQLLTAIRGFTEPNAKIIEMLLRYRYERRRVHAVVISQNDVVITTTAAEEELRNIYDEAKDKLIAPEFRRATYIHLTPKEIAKEILIPEKNLREAYQSRKDEFTKPATRKIKQFVFDSKSAALNAKINAEKSRSFVTALKYMAKTVSKEKATSLRDITKRDFNNKQEKIAAFGTAVGQLSDPIKTAFGWKIFLIESEQPRVIASFQEASIKIREELAGEKALDALFDLTNQFEDSLASGATIEEAARTINVKLRRLPFTNLQGMNQTSNAQTDIPQSRQFLSTLFSTLKGEQSNLIETEEGGYFLLRPDEILETRKLSFLEAKAKVKAQWDTAQRKRLIMDKAKTLADASKGGIGLKNAAVNAGYKVNTTELFTRSADGLNTTRYPADLASIAFELSTGNVGVVEGSTKVAIIELNEIQKVITDKKSEEWKIIKQEIQASMQEDYIETTLQLLKTQHNISINRPFIEQLTVAQE